MYISLALAREYCGITEEISDTLLQVFVNQAEQRAEAFLNRPLSDLLDPLPTSQSLDVAPLTCDDAVKVGVLHWVADVVAQRETIVVGTISSTLETAMNILYPYRIGLGV